MPSFEPRSTLTRTSRSGHAQTPAKLRAESGPLLRVRAQAVLHVQVRKHGAIRGGASWTRALQQHHRIHASAQAHHDAARCQARVAQLPLHHARDRGRRAPRFSAHDPFSLEKIPAEGDSQIGTHIPRLLR